MNTANSTLLLLLLPAMLSGCASWTRPLTDAALGAGGAALGHKLSGGNPLATAGGAAAGVLVGEGIQAWKGRSTQKAYTQGFVKGRSDGIKEIYWSLQSEQSSPPSPTSFREVRVPAHRDGGVDFMDTKRNISN